MINILITGSNGFIGSELIKYLANSNKYKIFAVSRKQIFFYHINIKNYYINDSNIYSFFNNIFEDIDIVVHLAGIAHQFKDNLESKKKYYDINTFFTKKLLEQSIKKKVKKFIFISSVKVYGEQNLNNDPNKPFSYLDKPNPMNDYSKSKYQAENIITKLCQDAYTDYTIIRSPLVYGNNLKGNFERLIRLLEKNLPLPFKSITNKRSYVSIYNLIDFIEICILNKKSNNKIFLISDSTNLSTPELINKISLSIGKKNKLFFFPTKILYLFFFIFNKKKDFNRITSSLTVDISNTYKILNWKPKITFDQSLKIMFNNNGN